MSISKKFAVVGNPIKHSLSPRIHNIFAREFDLDISYEALCIEPEEFELSITKLFEKGYQGLNVTLPLKELAFEFADNLSEESDLCRSVNTLWMKGSTRCADSTDGRGLITDLNNKNIKLKKKEIVILGAGGSAKAIIPSILRESPKRLTIINRTFSNAEQVANHFSSLEGNIDIISISESLNFQPDLVLNTSSAGIIDQDFKLPENLFGDHTCVYDLSYSEELTPFIKIAVNSGIKDHFDGLGMLIEQAALSFEIWTGLNPNTRIDRSQIF